MVTWLLEENVFPASGRFLEAVRECGHIALPFDDAMWTGDRAALDTKTVIFRGSLGYANRIFREQRWRPGAYCRASEFHCSVWYPRAADWLLNREWCLVSVQDLVADPRRALSSLGSPEKFFVRPDSPLKPFSGRVLSRDTPLSLASLDHGFYYEDHRLPVVAAPVKVIGAEWRYVIVDRGVVAGSRYTANGRMAVEGGPGGAPWDYAAGIAARLEPPEEVYVLDICESDGELRLLELNPFSGADLYACDAAAVVEAVSAFAERLPKGSLPLK